MFQRNRPFEDLDIASVHFLLHLRKEMQEVGIQAVRGHLPGMQPNQGEVLQSFCAHNQFIFRCNGENTCACCPECSNIWLIRTHLKLEKYSESAGLRQAAHSSQYDAPWSVIFERSKVKVMPESGISPKFNHLFIGPLSTFFFFWCFNKICLKFFKQFWS